MKFTKMHGCGNNYVYVNCFEETVKDPAKMAIAVSNINYGIGSDGLILIGPSEKANFKMSMYNSDGSEGSMCGNGIRCVAKYVYDYGLTKNTSLRIETKSGIKVLELSVKEGKVDIVKVDMGKVLLGAKDVPVVSDKEKVINEPVVIAGNQYNITCVSMGNPHCVVFVDDVDSLDLEKIGPEFENHEMFPDRVNTEFIQVIDNNNIKMRVWERGSGETFACGTGACAAAVACVLNGKTDSQVTVHLRGGDLQIKYLEPVNNVFMTGPAATICDGEYFE